MIQEREPLKEPVQQNCNYCGPGFPATKEFVSDKGSTFVCDKHYTVLQKIENERIRFEAEWMLTSHYEEDHDPHRFENIDEWEDGSMNGF